MADKLTPIRIFISSPGDLSKEREIVRSTIAELNESPHYKDKYRLIVYAYEGSVPALAGESPQIVVDKFLLLPNHSDVLVCMMWLHMGTPTDGLINPETGQPYQSGTEYEFLTAYRAQQSQDRPLILLYQYIKPPENINQVDLEQWERVRKFFDRFKTGGDLKGFVTEIKDANELHNVLRNDLERLLVYEIAKEDHTISNNSPVENSSTPIYFLPDNLPLEYVPRSQALDMLRQSLLGSHSTVGLIGATAVHGQGGLGKTVLARAICDDPAVRGAFSDGILWATLGQDSEPVRHQRNWIVALGGNVSAASSVDAGKVELRRLLRDRAILLILDDVWNINDVQALNVGGQGSRLLITTRDVTQVGPATLVPLEQMRNLESRELLRIASRNTLADDTLLDIISERLGHLPLALNIVGAMLGRGILWDDILSALNEGDIKFIRYGQMSVLGAIATSIAHLPSAHQQRYFELVAFPKDQPLNLDVVTSFWGTTGKLSRRNARQLVVEFRDMALLQSDNTIHDLQYDYLQSVVPIDEQKKLHSKIADIITPIEWSPHYVTSGQNYGIQRLAYHLFHAGRLIDLESLITNFMYLKMKIDYLGTAALLKDFAFSNKEIYKKISGALEFSAHILDRSPKQLYNQLFGRTGSVSQLHNIMDEMPPFINLLSPTLTSPNTSLLNELDGHMGGLKGCNFVPGGHYVVSTSIDGTLRLWNIESAKTTRTFEGHRGTVNDCSVSSDGKYILSASVDCTLRLWNVNTGQTERVFEGHSDEITTCRFSGDSKYCISASVDKTLRLWDISSGRTIRVFDGHKDTVKSCDIDEERGLVFSGSRDRTVKIWDVNSGINLYTLEGHDGEVASVSFCRETRMLASSSYDGTIRLWDTNNMSLINVIHTHISGVLSVKISKDGQNLICGSWDRTLKSWNIGENRMIHEYLGHKGGINNCSISDDGRFALSASWDSTLRLWNIITGEVIKVFEGFIGRVSSCHFSPNGNYAVSAYGDRTIKLWKLPEKNIVHTLLGHDDYVRGCSFSPNSLRLASTSEDHTVRLWDVKTGELLRTYTGHMGPTRDCIFTPDGRFLLSASWDKTIRQWDVETGKIVWEYEGHTGHVNSLSIDNKGLIFISVSDDKTLRVWDIVEKKMIAVLEGHSDFVRCCDLNYDGSLAITSSIDGTIYLWDIKEKNIRHILKRHTLYVRDCCFSKDGRFIVSVSDDNILRLWDTETGNELTSWPGDDALMCCAVHPFQKELMVGDGLGNVHFFSYTV